MRETRNLKTMRLNAEQVRRLVQQTGLKRPTLARRLGYRSENSLRACESGGAMLPAGKARWLEAYATLRAEHAAIEAAWLAQNPEPDSGTPP